MRGLLPLALLAFFYPIQRLSGGSDRFPSDDGASSS